MKHMPNLKEFTKEEIKSIIELGIKIKNNPLDYSETLKGKTLAMWFEKSSLRTRVSFETGMTQLGGHAIYMDSSTTHKKASIKDEIKTLSRYVDAIMARVYDNNTIKKMTEASTVPVVNGLCNIYHPCQALADVMTMYEISKKFEGLTVAYIGDGNNVCNSLIIACKKLGIKINVSTPESLKPNTEPDFWSNSPKDAVKNTDFVYTDTWVSMGNEEKSKDYISKLKPYQVNKELIGDKYFMHCLPAIRGQEVTNEVLDSDKSIIFDQAENRMHIQKAILVTLLNK